MAGPFGTKKTWSIDYKDAGKGLGYYKGGTLVYINAGNPDGTHAYYMVYPMPPGQKSNFVAYKFDDFAQVQKTLGGDPNNWNVYSWSKAMLQQYAPAIAPAAEIIGQSGDWTGIANGIMQTAAAKAGITDPTLIGKMWSDPDMQRIMGQAVVGDWTDEQILAEQRKTKFWTETLYPGIKNLYNLTAEPEREYLDYVAQVTPGLQALGYAPDAAGSYKTHIKKMLDKKIDSNIFESQVPTFIRATQNAEFSAVLNQWAERDLGRTIGFEDWFDLMAGEAQPELDDIAERATLEWVAQSRGNALTQNEVEGIAARTQMSMEEMQQTIAEFNQGIIGMGDEALGRYGLSRDEVLSAAAGVAPMSGRTVDEIKLLVAKTAREQGMFDDDKINFYVGFNPLGQPNRPGLTTLSPEGA